MNFDKNKGMGNMIFYAVCCMIFVWMAYSAYMRFDEALDDWKSGSPEAQEYHLHDDEEVFPEGKVMRGVVVLGVFRSAENAEKNGLVDTDLFISSKLNTMGREYGDIMGLYTRHGMPIAVPMKKPQ